MKTDQPKPTTGQRLAVASEWTPEMVQEMCKLALTGYDSETIADAHNAALAAQQIHNVAAQTRIENIEQRLAAEKRQAAFDIVDVARQQHRKYEQQLDAEREKRERLELSIADLSHPNCQMLLRKEHQLREQLAEEKRGFEAAAADSYNYMKQLAAAQAAILKCRKVAELLRDEYWSQTPLDVAKLADEILQDQPDTTALDAAIAEAVEKQKQSDDRFYYRQIDGISSQHRQDLQNAIAAAQQPLVGALKEYMVAMDALYNHNEATRAAVVQHFGTLHPQSAMVALAKAEPRSTRVKEGK